MKNFCQCENKSNDEDRQQMTFYFGGEKINVKNEGRLNGAELQEYHVFPHNPQDLRQGKPRQMQVHLSIASCEAEGHRRGEGSCP